MAHKISTGWFYWISAVTAALGIATATPVFAQSVAVPFHGTFSGSAWFDSATTARFEGTGTLTHLGSSTNIGVLAPLIPMDTTECEAGWGIPHVNIETLTAANGDQLVLQMNDLACPVAVNVFRGTGAWQVIRGTGRFSNASGWGTVIGGGDFNLGIFEFSLSGRITY